MTICKIVKCRELAYRARLCRAHYAHWLEHDELPGPTKAEPRETQPAWSPSHEPRGYKANLLRKAEAVAVAARKWAAHDESLRAAIDAYDEAKL
jgi:hypothetical protein